MKEKKKNTVRPVMHSNLEFTRQSTLSMTCLYPALSLIFCHLYAFYHSVSPPSETGYNIAQWGDWSSLFPDFSWAELHSKFTAVFYLSCNYIPYSCGGPRDQMGLWHLRSKQASRLHRDLLSTSLTLEQERREMNRLQLMKGGGCRSLFIFLHCLFSPQKGGWPSAPY